MTYVFNHPVELAGPAGVTIEAIYLIVYSYSEPDESVNWHGGITIEDIDVVIGRWAFEFNGDFKDPDLLAACREHMDEEQGDE